MGEIIECRLNLERVTNLKLNSEIKQITISTVDGESYFSIVRIEDGTYQTKVLCFSYIHKGDKLVFSYGEEESTDEIYKPLDDYETFIQLKQYNYLNGILNKGNDHDNLTELLGFVLSYFDQEIYIPFYLNKDIQINIVERGDEMLIDISSFYKTGNSQLFEKVYSQEILTKKNYMKFKNVTIEVLETNKETIPTNILKRDSFCETRDQVENKLEILKNKLSKKNVRFNGN